MPKGIPNKKPWEPKPDMGKVAPPPEAEKVCLNCPEPKATHYGGPKGWCNAQGCNCQEFK